jgi:FMN-dependent NADH-azoreductase
MSTLLQINSSLFGALGQSSRLTQAFADRWRVANPHGHIIQRDVAAQPLPHFDAEIARAFRGQAAELTAHQLAALELSDTLIAEFKRADAIVLGVPMYNFGVPSQLKTYLDYIARAGVTFRYTEQGPIGLLPQVPVYVLSSRGGFHQETESDAQTPFLRTYFQFLGLRQIYFVYAEGLNVNEQSRQTAMSQAFTQIGELAGRLRSVTAVSPAEP